MNESNSTMFKKGMFFGLGFFLPIFLFGLILVMAQSINLRSHHYDIHNKNIVDSPKKKSEKSGIEIVSYRDFKNENYTYIVGSYKNVSNEAVRSFYIEAEFYDKDGNIVWLEQESVYRNIEPNESHNFAIKCGCKEHAIPEYTKVVMSTYN